MGIKGAYAHAIKDDSHRILVNDIWLKSVSGFFILLLLLNVTASPVYGEVLWPQLVQNELLWVSEQIYQNECSGNPRYLTHWNKGEEFPSFGIGHFIWYPEGQTGIYEESFPDMLRHMEKKGTVLPDMLSRPEGGAPWMNREIFYSAKNSKELAIIREFLLSTKSEQFSFMIHRFKIQMPEILAKGGSNRAELEQKVTALLDIRGGVYPLVDYLNFKGAGVSEKERYQGKGWGLLQVLLRMKDPADDLVAEFQKSARETLAERVRLSPAGRNESRWLAGWNKRIDTYSDVYRE